MLCRTFIVAGWFVGLCLLIMSPETKCIDIAKSLTQLLDNFKDASYLPREIHFGLNLAYKLLSGSVVVGSSLANPSGDSDRSEFYWKTLEYLKVLKSGSHTRNISVNDEIILESISENSEVWQRNVKHRHLDIVKPKDTFSVYEWIVDKGHPTAIDSDKCMSQLGSTKTCVISSKCVSMMISQEPAYGYHKTHQLLFLFMTVLKSCSNLIPHNRSIDVIIAEKCSDIYKEQMILMEYGIPNDYRDLFMEQSLFCGIMGYSEFLSMTLLKPIPRWQSSNGCFNSKSTENKNPECRNHINSLGLALYSNIILQFSTQLI
ncbi:uncharacterized protein LOC129905698 isoform X2 [Episyrphus balteatus]|uniref:uncharacterized protein LOC129905698 isoform X2 n=1 Tax=Episyrphus balteatus TaxID=286459 RepID=UPI002485E45A|nr:uncharacterized protein LOC129905698 isoform X2 [Episyrphus balteatus]